MNWLCSSCENYDPVFSEIPVFPEVSPLELVTRIHPVKVLKPSIKTYYKPLKPTVSVLALDDDDSGDEAEDNQKIEAEDHKLPDFFESRKTDDLFANTIVGNESSSMSTKRKYKYVPKEYT